MFSSSQMLAALQEHLGQRGVEVERLTTDTAIDAMIEWFRSASLLDVSSKNETDVLVHRYGGWSEGCVTGFKFSVLRQIAKRDAVGGETQWLAGITLMFEPSRYADLEPFSTVSTDWQSLEAFRNAIRSSPAYALCGAVIPSGVIVESGGLR